MDVEVLEERVCRLRKDFDSHKQENAKEHDEFREGIRDIIQVYANRPPVWTTSLIAFLTFLAGILVTLVVK